MKTPYPLIIKKSPRIRSLLVNEQGKLEAGFALIATVSVMVLLFMIAVAMLTLSSVEMRSAKAGAGMEQARSNARLALMMAISELQAMAGPDTRVTAPADAVAETSDDAPRQLTGVWRSWEGNNHDKSTGLPIAPNYGSKLQTGEIDYDSSDEGRFLGWLISGDEKDNNADNPPTLAEGADTVPLLGEGALGTGSTDLEVHLVPTPLSTTGSIAYWIQGENTKAHLKQEIETEPTDDAEWSKRLASYGRADGESFGFDDTDELAKALTLQTLDLMSNSNSDSVSTTGYHDVTTRAKGLLTNTANGGWRRDLSLMAEKWSDGDLDQTGLPVFSIEPYSDEETSSLTIADNSTDGSLYPWAEVSGISMSWNALMDFTSLYKKVKTKQTPTSTEPYFEMVPNNNSDWNSILPVMARIHWSFSYDGKDNGDGTYTPRCILRPAITLWNPYNVAVEADKYKLQFRVRAATFPINIYATIGNQAERSLSLQRMLSGKANANANQGRIVVNAGSAGSSSDPTLKPGESRVFGKSTLSDVSNGFTYTSPGFEKTGGLTVNLSALNSSIVDGVATDDYSYRWDYSGTGDAGSNVSATLLFYLKDYAGLEYAHGSDFSDKTMNYNMAMPFDTVAEKMPLPELVNDDETLSSAANGDNEPFLVVSLGLRTIRDEDPDDEMNKLHTKGYIDNKWISGDQTITAGSHIEDSPYIWEFFSPNTDEDPFIPQTEEALCYGNDHSGYIGSSFQASLGLNRWAIAELPTQPLLSLAELQHFDISYRNLSTPKVTNAIGNSHASSRVSPEEIQLDRGEGAGSVIGHDHSYVSNHILFDDWFFSSITPDYETFTQTEERSIEEVYADHLTGETRLPNSQYLPASVMSETDAEAAASETIAERDVWQNIASELEVEGMFNINSTSVTAWKSLLMNQKNTEVPHASIGVSSEDDWETKLSALSESPFSRTTVAGDPLSASDPDVALIATHMTMSENEVEALATEIVEQIKKRGPFLSLAEFINRQVRDDNDDLALAGTVESALIALSEASTNNPYTEIQAAYPEQATLPTDAASIYEFPEAAVGYAAYGTPGWARQADVIRSLAPIMSARDDTFKIRAYGEAKDSNGNVIAKSWCEAVVQRRANYVDASNSAADKTNLLSDDNKHFGRRFEIISFRWLSQDEV